MQHRRSDKSGLGFGMAAVVPALGFSVSWICCLPLVVGGAGAGTALFASAAGAFRPVFVSAAVLMLGAAFYQAYRPGATTCGPDGVCRPRSRRLWPRIALWLLAALTVGFLTIDRWSSSVILWFL